MDTVNRSFHKKVVLNYAQFKSLLDKAKVNESQISSQSLQDVLEEGHNKGAIKGNMKDTSNYYGSDGDNDSVIEEDVDGKRSDYDDSSHKTVHKDAIGTNWYNSWESF